MKNLISIILLVSSCFCLNAQDQYATGMEKAFGLWSENKPMEAVALFERISQAEKDNWLPAYYTANVLITSSFNLKDESKINEQLKKAKQYIELAHERSEKNSEIKTLEGLLYTAYIAFDPPTYAMTYSQKVLELHQEAIGLDNVNPRAQLNMIEFEIGSARFFNQDLTTFCKRLEEVVPLFDSQKKETPFAPQYGKERVDSIKKQCGC